MSFDIQKAIDYRDLSTTVAKRLVDDIRASRYDIQPKYDGCHARFVFANGECKVLSSLGNEVKSCGHIAEQLARTKPTQGVIHGEVWRPGSPFQEISGDFRRQSPSPSLLFVPFDFTKSLGADDRPYWLRSQDLVPLDGTNIIRVGTRAAKPEHDLFAMARYQQGLGGYDGLVLRHRGKPYKLGRCRDGEVIKIKPLVSLDLKVLEVFPEKGAKTGKNTCALGLRWHSSTVQRVATGLTQAQVDAFVADPASIVGKIVEVEAMGYTSDGFLREPRFIRIRDDKEIPDV